MWGMEPGAPLAETGSTGPAADASDPDRAAAAGLRELIRDVPNFPREGIVFKDITALLSNAAAFRAAIDILVAAHADAGVDVVVGVEARGFVLGGALAHQLGAGFVPVRKRGRLPRSTLSAAYALEYGEAVLEIHEDALLPGQRVLVVDDLLATGGTARATVDLVERLGGVVVSVAFLVELAALEGARALGDRAHVSLIRF